VDQADHGTLGLVPDRDHLRRRQQLHLAAVARKVGGRLLRQGDPAVLPGADEQPDRPLLVEVLGLGQRDGMRGPVDGLGQLLLALLHLTIEPDDHIMGEDRSIDGDRAELCLIDPGLHGPSPPLAPDEASSAVRERAAWTRPAEPTYTGPSQCRR
jgi:hypothetical protein